MHRREPRIRGLATLLLVLVAGPALAQSEGQPAVERSKGAASKPASPSAMPPPTSGLRVLEQVWPDYPEWAAMLVDILQGSQLGPYDGWFRKAVAHTRYDWVRASGRFDADHDGAISEKELGASEADFDRADRDHSGRLEAADFDFSAHALTPTPGMMLFQRTDRDGNGRLTREEFAALYDSIDSEKDGFVSLSDMQRLLPAAGANRGGSSSSKASKGPSRATLVRGLIRQEIGSLQAGPAVGETAPDFALRTVDGSREIRLSELIGAKPLVLVFGNFTCGPFRSQSGDVEKLYQRYKDRANFLMVYVREAHPRDGWNMESNERVGVDLVQPRSYSERVSVAQTCSKTLELSLPMLVDTIDDAVGARYSGMPSRLYLIDTEGKVAYKSGRGPFGFKPAELEHALLMNLVEASSCCEP